MVLPFEAVDGAAQGGGGLGVDFWAALLSLVTAVVVTVGPALVRKLLPGDSTVADIARSSTTTIAESLDRTIELVSRDLGAMRTQIEENGRKLDAIDRRGRR